MATVRNFGVISYILKTVYCNKFFQRINNYSNSNIQQRKGSDE